MYTMVRKQGTGSWKKMGSQKYKRISEVLSESVGSVSVSGESQKECRCPSSKLQFWLPSSAGK